MDFATSVGLLGVFTFLATGERWLLLFKFWLVTPGTMIIGFFLESRGVPLGPKGDSFFHFFQEI